MRQLIIAADHRFWNKSADTRTSEDFASNSGCLEDPQLCQGSEQQPRCRICKFGRLLPRPLEITCQWSGMPTARWCRHPPALAGRVGTATSGKYHTSEGRRWDQAIEHQALLIRQQAGSKDVGAQPVTQLPQAISCSCLGQLMAAGKPSKEQREECLKMGLERLNSHQQIVSGRTQRMCCNACEALEEVAVV